MEPMHFARIQSCTINANLLAFKFEPLPIYIGITKSFKFGLREEVGDWKKNACSESPDLWTRVPLFYTAGQP
jgi:hypothetical protein